MPSMLPLIFLCWHGAVVPGTPEEIPNTGILELQLNAARKGDALQSSLMMAAKTGKTNADGNSPWQKELSKTVPAGSNAADVLTIDSRPNTGAARP